MTVLGVGLRLAAQALLFAAILPPHWLAMRWRWRLAGWLPVVFHRMFLRLFGVRVVVRGGPPAGAPTLVLANHVSWLDIPVLGSLQPLSFIAKSEVAGWPVIGLFAKLQRSVFIERTRKGHTAEVNRQVARRLRENDVIVLFAEGTSGDGNRVLPFRASLVGAARAALADPAVTQVDLKPLAIAYVRRDGLPLTRRERPTIAWYGAMELGRHLAGFFRGGPIDAVVAWGEPIRFDAESDRKRATAAAEAAVRAAMRAAVRGEAACVTGASPRLAYSLAARESLNRAPSETLG